MGGGKAMDFNYISENYKILINDAITKAVASEIFGNGFRQHVIDTMMTSGVFKG